MTNLQNKVWSFSL